MPSSLYFLALAVFAMGTSEFMLAGLVPDIAADLNVSVGSAGTLTSAFAVGMVVGAPATAVLVRRWPQRSALLVLLAGFALSHLAAVAVPSFVPLVGTRVVAALANAGFLAVALSAVTTLVPTDRIGRAMSVLLTGTTVATVVGVPAGALLGSALGWRATFVGVVALSATAFVGILRGVPSGRAGSGTTPAGRWWAEVAVLRRPALATTILLGAVVNAATFSTFTFLGPLVTDVAGLDPAVVPLALLVFGLGSCLGVIVAGRLADRIPWCVIGVGGALSLAGWLALAWTATNPVAMLVLPLVQGALSFAVGSTVISRVLSRSDGAPTMGGAYATVALNLGAVAGPLLAAAALDGGGGRVAPVWVSVGLAAAALPLAAAASACQDRTTRRSVSGWARR